MSPARVSPRWKRALPVLAAVAVLAPLAWLWQASLVPEAQSIAAMGDPDYGGGPGAATTGGTHGHGGHDGAEARPVTALVADPGRPADVAYDLVARQAMLTVGGTTIAGFTVNGSSPGPELRAEVGQLIQVRLRNESVADGVTLHWHGVNVPNAMDGVAGVTQDAVPPGGEFLYRFVAEQVGTYWYHSHQVSNPQVAGGLFGALVVLPKGGVPEAADVTALAHTYGGVRTINGQPGEQRVLARPGDRVRLRVINSDNGSMEVWASAPYRLLAVDGAEINRPTPVQDKALTITAGGRADLELTVPDDGAAVVAQLSRASAVVIGPSGAAATVPPQPRETVDLLGYGSPKPTGIDWTRPDRRFDYKVARRPGFVRGVPGLWWSMNGHLYPNVPMYVVREDDVVVMHLDNASSDVHPMHLHGHRVLVLARDGVAATGSPWWTDSLQLLPGETYDIAFVADNPGIWMDHCHNLKHAAEGMIAHLMYEGVNTPFVLGGGSDNRPE